MDRRLISMLCVGALTLWALTAQAQDAAAPEPAAPAVSISPDARDDQIATRIRDILSATGWFRGPQVRVDDGVVFLDGFADSAEHSDWARALAGRTQDVVAVVNRIEVEARPEWSFAPALAEIERLIGRVVAHLPLIVLALIVVPLAWWAARGVAALTRKVLSGRVGSLFLRDVIARAVALPVLLIGVYLVLQVAGLTRLAFSFLGGAGLLGVVIGFAFRDIAENFLASLLLSIRQPFAAGDLISVDGREGIVQSMNTRSTVLLSVEGNHIQIPNAAVFKSVITNYSAAPNRREVLEVGIGFDDSVAKAQQEILAVLRAHDAVLAEPAPMVLVHALGAATVDLRAFFWFDGAAYSPLKVRSALLRRIKVRLMESGISMPDAAREIIFPQGVPILSGDASAAPQPAPAPREDERASERAEGGLESEQSEIVAQAADSPSPEGGEDLLSR